MEGAALMTSGGASIDGTGGGWSVVAGGGLAEGVGYTPRTNDYEP